MAALALMDVLRIAAGSGVVTALVTAGITCAKKDRQEKAQCRLEAEIDAIHLVTRLDALAICCANNYWAFHSYWDQVRGSEHERDL